MKRKTIPILVVVVLLFGWLAHERRQEERALADVAPERAMFEGFAPERVQVLRIDHLQRGFQLRLERDANGIWFLTEPVPYPAEGALVRTILDQLAASRGPIDREPNLAAQLLDEPLVVVEARGDTGGGDEHTWRVEIGGLDLDERLIAVRVPGHPAAPPGRKAAVLRVSRSLRTTLDRNPDDFRDPRATHLAGQSVVALTRRGVVRRAVEGTVALDLDARKAGSWRRTDPPAVRLDDTALGWLARGAAELRVERFVDDSPDDLSRFWLQDPAFTIELTTERGQVEKLLFACDRGPGSPPAEDATWYAMREGFPHVWGVSWTDIRLLATPARMLVDTRIMHVLREDVLRVELAGGERTLVLEIEDGSWWVTESPPGAQAARFPADAGAVEDLLAVLEQTELGDCPADLDPPGAEADSLSITSRTGERFGGVLGAAWRDPESGRAGVVYRRHGDEMLQLLDEKVAALWGTPLDRLRSLVLFDVDEFLVDRVQISSGEARQLYVRDRKEWQEATSRLTAPLDTQILLGDLMHLRAAEWVGRRGEGDTSERVEIRLWGRFPGGEARLVLARGVEGEALFLRDTGEAARLATDVHARLRALFR